MKQAISVVGARPNFMKVAPIHRAFARYASSWEHNIVHTGQHYDAAMSDSFFADLEMPHPKWFMGVGSGSHGEQTAKIMVGFEEICLESRPDCVIVVGDVNSTVACALVSVKLGIPTVHVESGLRSYDRSMPEEINRLTTDAIVDEHFVTEQSGLDNLIREGVDASRIHFVGNTMIDSLHYALPKAARCEILERLGLAHQGYCLVTMHRPSNVDHPEQLSMLLGVIEQVSQVRPVVFPVHPRTRKKMQELGITMPPSVYLIDAVRYVEFLALMRSAAVVLTDSGGIQEETTALGVPCITARTTTERPSTCELGTNVLVEPSADAILHAMAEFDAGRHKSGFIPPLWDGHAAERIVDLITAHYS